MTENMKLWINELRTTDVAQTRRFLAIVEPDGTEKFCAVGVACELAYQHGACERDDRQARRSSGTMIASYDGLSAAAPDAVMNWLLGADRRINGVDLMAQVTRWNDVERLPFREIANRIEALLEVVL